MGRLDDKVAVVTGAGRGIGREIALLLASEGAKVVVNDLGANTDGTGTGKIADDVVNEIRAAGGEAVSNTASVAEVSGGESMLASALDAFGGMDILVNNAGILRDVTIFKMEESTLKATTAARGPLPATSAKTIEPVAVSSIFPVFPACTVTSARLTMALQRQVLQAFPVCWPWNSPNTVAP
jgi:NAD(P)-dependent dehydrogenase (short-subunit alcohol dehydrogenase family)